jgi:hypothetical protein
VGYQFTLAIVGSLTNRSEVQNYMQDKSKGKKNKSQKLEKQTEIMIQE